MAYMTMVIVNDKVYDTKLQNGKLYKFCHLARTDRKRAYVATHACLPSNAHVLWARGSRSLVWGLSPGRDTRQAAPV